MNPVVINCILLYFTVLIISLVQSRLKIFTDNPKLYILLIIVTPIIVLGKAKNIHTWTGLTSFEIFGYTIMLAFLNVKRVLPRINEGYIYAYTLLHWYLLLDTIIYSGWNFWLISTFVISLYPTYITIKTSLEHKLVSRVDKIILFYWFLFTISFTYIDQVALEVIEPVTALYEVSLLSVIIVFISALQLYFMSTVLTLLFIAIPLFYLDKSGGSFRKRWQDAMADYKITLTYKIGSYIDYQISRLEVIAITIISGILFYIDHVTDFRGYLVLIYILVLPLIFFYYKWSPSPNIEND